MRMNRWELWGRIILFVLIFGIFVVTMFLTSQKVNNSLSIILSFCFGLALLVYQYHHIRDGNSKKWMCVGIFMGSYLSLLFVLFHVLIIAPLPSLWPDTWSTIVLGLMFVIVYFGTFVVNTVAILYLSKACLEPLKILISTKHRVGHGAC